MYAGPELILTVPPDSGSDALAFGLPLGHMAYRVGGGPHLFRASRPVAARGGYMVIDDTGFDGRGVSTPFCHEVLRECTARGFRGILCDFSAHPLQLLGQIAGELARLGQDRSLPVMVTEPYAAAAETAGVLISSALSGGSLHQRLTDAVASYGAQRVVLAVERVALDFFLPAATGQGLPLTREQLRTMLDQRAPSVFFSDELCARYFTFMSRENGAHFVLFDDADTIRKKLRVAQALGISRAVLAYPQVDDLLPQLLA